MAATDAHASGTATFTSERPPSVVGSASTSNSCRLGLFAGEATMHADFDELPADIAAAFGME